MKLSSLEVSRESKVVKSYAASVLLRIATSPKDQHPYNQGASLHHRRRVQDVANERSCDPIMRYATRRPPRDSMDVGPRVNGVSNLPPPAYLRDASIDMVVREYTVRARGLGPCRYMHATGICSGS